MNRYHQATNHSLNQRSPTASCGISKPQWIKAWYQFIQNDDDKWIWEIVTDNADNISSSYLYRLYFRFQYPKKRIGGDGHGGGGFGGGGGWDALKLAIILYLFKTGTVSI